MQKSLSLNPKQDKRALIKSKNYFRHKWRYTDVGQPFSTDSP